MNDPVRLGVPSLVCDAFLQERNFWDPRAPTSTPMPPSLRIHKIRRRTTGLLVAVCAVISGCLAPERVVSPEPESTAPASGGTWEIPISEVHAPEPPRVDPLEAMRPRYQPGPSVTLETLLPAAIEVYDDDPHVYVARLLMTESTQHSPWAVGNARFHNHDLPSPQGAQSEAPRIRARGNQHIITVVPRVASFVPLEVEDPNGIGDIRALLIAFDGYRGHFLVPMMLETENPLPSDEDGHTGAQFTIAAALPPGASVAVDRAFPATMRVAVVDRAGNVSAPVTQNLEVIPLGTGDLEVTLNMSRATDLDLYVVEPSGAAVYFGRSRSPSGAVLDLDANAACGGNMGVTSEHIYWPSGRVNAGTYHVRVANYMSCGGNDPVNYTVTVLNCGETAVLSGRFDGAGNSSSCSNITRDHPDWCHQVLTFDVVPCASAAQSKP